MKLSVALLGLALSKPVYGRGGPTEDDTCGDPTGGPKDTCSEQLSCFSTTITPVAGDAGGCSGGDCRYEVCITMDTENCGKAGGLSHGCLPDQPCYDDVQPEKDNGDWVYGGPISDLRRCSVGAPGEEILFVLKDGSCCAQGLFPTGGIALDNGGTLTCKRHGDFPHTASFCAGGPLNYGAECVWSITLPNECAPECTTAGDCGSDPCMVYDCVNGECRESNKDCDAELNPGQCQSTSCDSSGSGCYIVDLPSTTACDDGNLCTVGDRCTGDGTCQSGSASYTGCASSSTCMEGYCDAGANSNDPAVACKEMPVPNDDMKDCGSTPCTTRKCVDGACASDPVTCPPTASTCMAPQCVIGQGCGETPANEGMDCAGDENNGGGPDNNLCTAHKCNDLGQCVPDPQKDVVCPQSTQCMDYVCDPADGVCKESPKTGSSCSDGNMCTENDTCNAQGQCVGTPVVCGAAPDCKKNVCYADRGCVEENDDMDTCDDGNACNGADTCVAGTCQSGSDICPGGRCLLGVCENNACTTVPDTTDPSCSGPTPCGDCSTFDDPDNCKVGWCNEATNTCEAKGVDDGESCADDEDACTVDQCNAGQCKHTPMDCSGLNDECNVGQCVNGACEKVPDNEGSCCDDGVECTTMDVCVAGVCVGTDGCAGNQCQMSECNAQTGQCHVTNKPDNTVCDDGVACTVSTCQEGVCTGTPMDCSGQDTGNPCTQMVCDPATDACVEENSPAGTDCSAAGDGISCTNNEMCDGEGNCVGTPDCPAGDECTTYTCDATADECVEQPTNAPGCCKMDSECTNPANPCRGMCVDGLCDYNAAKPDLTTVCDDGLKCTSYDGEVQGLDMCVAGECVSEPVDCPSGPCFTSSCSEEGTGECVITPNLSDPSCGDCSGQPDGTPCDDQDPCTMAGTAPGECRNGICTGEKMDCSYLNDPCKTYHCENVGGQAKCVAAPDCGYGVWDPEADVCLCYPLESPAPGPNPGFCHDEFGRCTAFRKFDEPTGQFYCGPTPPLPPPPPTCEVDDDCNALNDGCVRGVCAGGVCQPSPNCVHGFWNPETQLCDCQGGPAPSLGHGYCRDETGACTIPRAYHFETQQYYCGQGPPAPRRTPCATDDDCSGLDDGCVEGVCGDDGFCTTQADCVHGHLIDGECVCDGGSGPTAGPGYCHDELGACTRNKVWNAEYGVFICPGTECTNCGGGPGAPATEPAGGCVHGVWDAAALSCKCTWGEWPSQFQGYCVDPTTGACTVVMTYGPTVTGDYSRPFYCPSGRRRVRG